MADREMTFRHRYFPESGNSSKLALLLTLCGETFEPVWTYFGGGVTRTAECAKPSTSMHVLQPSRPSMMSVSRYLSLPI